MASWVRGVIVLALLALLWRTGWADWAAWLLMAVSLTFFVVELRVLQRSRKDGA